MSDFKLYNYRKNSCNSVWAAPLALTSTHCCHRGGFMAGLGAGIGSWLGGLLTGGLNMFGFGMGNGFGFGNGFGMGTYGLGGYQGNGNSWLNNLLGNGKDRDGKSVRAGATDDDAVNDNDNKFNDLDDPKIKALETQIEEAKTKEQLEAALKEADKIKELLTDDYTDDKNTEELALQNLVKKAEGKLGDLEDNADPDNVEGDESADATRNAGGAGGNPVNGANDPDGADANATTGGANGTANGELPNDITTLTQEAYNNLDPNKKTDAGEMFATSLKDKTLGELEALANNTNLPDSFRALARKAACEQDGYTNVTKDGLAKVNRVELADDTGAPRDVTDDKGGDNVSENREEITLVDNKLTQAYKNGVEYTLDEDKSNDNERIYKSPNGQYYLLQQKGDKYYLMQYKVIDSKGWNIPDIKTV